MERESLPGQTGRSTSVNILIIKNRVLAYSKEMEKVTKGTGIVGVHMAKERSLKEILSRKSNGIKDVLSTGNHNPILLAC
jgi:hypothetical protein